MRVARAWSCLALPVLLLLACGGDDDGAADDDGDDDGPRVDAAVPPVPPAVCDDVAALVDTSAPTHLISDCSSDVALRAAVDAGGTIAFACGDGPVTVTLTAPLHVAHDTVIDGGGVITLSGGDAVRVIEMDTGNFEATSPSLTVQRLTFTRGHGEGELTAGGGGAIYFVGGNVTVIDALFIDNQAVLEGPDVGGGAIYAVGAGTLTVSGSRFAGNRAANGGAIGLLGAALELSNSTFEGNSASGYGANYVEGGVQMGQGGNGGAISMDGQGRPLALCGATFQANSSGAFGGAVFRTGYASEPTTIHRSAFLDNQARDRTGAEDDLPSGAGALYLQGVHVTMTDSTVAGNQAKGSAGVWILGHGAATATADLTNVTLTGNATYPRADFTKRGVAGGLTIGDNTVGTLWNVTITGNAAQFGAGVWNVSPLILRNTIIANSAENAYTPLNCSGSSYAMPPASGSGNLQWPIGVQDDMDCTTGITRLDPEMGALGDHGGPTPTVLPTAADLPRVSDCPPTDQRGEPRATMCTPGAVERP
jgi:predicted outer membrane repeat protein